MVSVVVFDRGKIADGGIPGLGGDLMVRWSLGVLKEGSDKLGMRSWASCAKGNLDIDYRPEQLAIVFVR